MDIDGLGRSEIDVVWFVGTYDFDGSTDISDECTEWGESAHERILTGNVRVKYGGEENEGRRWAV